MEAIPKGLDFKLRHYPEMTHLGANRPQML